MHTLARVKISDKFHHAITPYQLHLQSKMNSVLSNQNDRVSLQYGKKYVRVVFSYFSHINMRAYAFVVLSDTNKLNEGDILRSASWKGPITHDARGNIYFPESYEHHSIYGL